MNVRDRFIFPLCHSIFMYYISYYNVYLLVVVVLLVQKIDWVQRKKYVFVFHLQCSVSLVRPCTLKSRGDTALLDSLGDLTTILYWFDTMKTENLILKFKLCYGKWYLLATFYYYNRRLWNYINDWGVEMWAFCKWNFKSSKKKQTCEIIDTYWNFKLMNGFESKNMFIWVNSLLFGRTQAQPGFHSRFEFVFAFLFAK